VRPDNEVSTRQLRRTICYEIKAIHSRFLLSENTTISENTVLKNSSLNYEVDSFENENSFDVINMINPNYSNNQSHIVMKEQSEQKTCCVFIICSCITKTTIYKQRYIQNNAIQMKIFKIIFNIEILIGT